jgi:hypothetical protein
VGGNEPSAATRGNALWFISKTFIKTLKTWLID